MQSHRFAQGLAELQDAKYTTGSGGVGFILYGICLGPVALVLCILALPFMAPWMWYGTLGAAVPWGNWEGNSQQLDAIRMLYIRMARFRYFF